MVQAVHPFQIAEADIFQTRCCNTSLFISYIEAELRILKHRSRRRWLDQDYLLFDDQTD